MAFTISNPRTREALRLLSVLATPMPAFMQPFEEKPWMEKQTAAFLALYRTHQDNRRVVEFLTEVDNGSRMDTAVDEAVMRARGIAVKYMESVLKDIDEEMFAPTAPKSGDSTLDLWTDGRHVERSDGLASEWGRQAVRERNKGIELEIDFRGYVAEKR